MTAIMNSSAVVEAHEAEVLSRTSTVTAIEEFLRDPIGYGDYDFADPISLGEFSRCRHMHGTYAALLS